MSETQLAALPSGTTINLAHINSAVPVIDKYDSTMVESVTVSFLRGESLTITGADAPALMDILWQTADHNRDKGWNDEEEE